MTHATFDTAFRIVAHGTDDAEHCGVNVYSVEENEETGEDDEMLILATDWPLERREERFMEFLEGPRTDWFWRVGKPFVFLTEGAELREEARRALLRDAERRGLTTISTWPMLARGTCIGLQLIAVADDGATYSLEARHAIGGIIFQPIAPEMLTSAEQSIAYSHKVRIDRART